MPQFEAMMLYSAIFWLIVITAVTYTRVITGFIGEVFHKIFTITKMIDDHNVFSRVEFFTVFTIKERKVAA